MTLTQGGNAPIQATRLQVRIGWQPSLPPGMELDVSAFLLAESGKVSSDADMVFYNQKQSPDGAVILETTAGPDNQTTVFAVDLARLGQDIHKVAFTVTVDAGEQRGQSLGQLQQLQARLVDALTGAEQLEFAFPIQGAREVAMTLIEIYRRQGQWKMRAVAQGYAGGLAPLARSYGVDVDESSATPPVAPSPTRSPTPPPVVPPAQSPAKVNLSKVTLEKKGESVSLEKKETGYGQIRINLNWSKANTISRGFFGRATKGIDLDLGCFVELTNGFKTVIQALGNRFGTLEEEPFMQLSGDDRTGENSDGENLLINGNKWSRIKRVLVYAFIYEGAPNWNATDGVVTVHVQNEPPLEVRLTDGRNDRAMCAIAVLENVQGGIKVTKLAEYFRGQSDMDRQYGWGFQWSAGSKD
ncbi:MAG: TerD family protein [Magnetococcales bacterium]|nr:TerD family protein [Magnetococcales bacterium]